MGLQNSRRLPYRGSKHGLYYVDENGNLVEYGTSVVTPETPGINAPRTPIIPPVVTDTKSGGGGGRDFEEEMEKLQEQFATEAEIVQLDYERQLEALAEFRANKAGTEEEFNELEARIKADHQTRMEQLERKSRDAQLNIAAGFFGDVASLMSSNNKKLFKIGQVAAVAQATIKGYQAAVDAWQYGMSHGGPAVAAALTAGSLVKTGALISSIASQSATGGGGNSAASAGGAIAEPPQQTSNQVAIQLVGGDQFGRGQIIQLVNAINEAQEDGAIVRLV